MKRSEWDSYVLMNQGYNAIFDGWQDLQEKLSPEVTNALNMGLSILDGALTEVKKTVKKPEKDKPSKPETSGFQVFGG